MRAAWIGLAVGLSGLGCGSSEIGSNSEALSPAAVQWNRPKPWRVADHPNMIAAQWSPSGAATSVLEPPDRPTPPACLVCPGTYGARFDNTVGSRVISPELEGSDLAARWGRPELSAQLTERIRETQAALAALSPEEGADLSAAHLIDALAADLDRLARQ